MPKKVYQENLAGKDILESVDLKEKRGILDPLDHKEPVVRLESMVCLESVAHLDPQEILGQMDLLGSKELGGTLGFGVSQEQEGSMDWACQGQRETKEKLGWEFLAGKEAPAPRVTVVAKAPKERKGPLDP